MKHIHLFYITWAIEIFIGISLLIALIIGKALYEIRERQRRALKEHFAQKIFLIMTEQKSVEEIDWDEKQPPRDLLLTILESHHANFQNARWRHAEAFLAKKFLLPWARQHVGHRRWMQRNHVARIFLLHRELQDYPSILLLLDDKSFFIRMIAVEALGEMQLQKSIKPLITKMAQEPASCRYIYRNTLLKMPQEYAIEILNLYEHSADRAIHLCCLDILSYRYFGDVGTLIQRDLNAIEPEIRIFVAKILGNIATEEAIDHLLILLDDREGKVREEAVRVCGHIRTEKAFAKVAALIHDPVYEVRLQAACALLAYKKAGREVLMRQDWDLDPLAYEVARYVLTSDV